ncbi:MAG: YqgQ family protein [Anaerobacillus sp.]|uniref:YqgQ family protein n=1 Tax=Anaerobacillus sp. TaxID=1872506 RepID=UPI00391A6899
MTTMYELRQFLQKHGAFIYTGDRAGDLELFEMELRQLYDWDMIDIKTLQQGLLILRKELNELQKIKND